MTESHAPGGEQWLRPGEVAGLLGISTRTLRRAAAAGRIEGLRTPGGHGRYTEADVTELRKHLRLRVVAVA